MRIRPLIARLALMCAPAIVQVSTAQADSVTMNKTTIVISNSAFKESSYSFVYQGTTYMSLYAVDQMLSPLGIIVRWNGNTGHWELSTTTAFTVPTLNNVTNEQAIYLNGNFYAGMQTYHVKDPTSGIETSFAPIWYVQQALKALDIQSTWNGTTHTWTVSDGSSVTSSGSTTQATYGVDNTIQLQNGATKDSQYWARADSDLYISAQTFDPTANPVPSSVLKLINLSVGQKLDLFAYSGDGTVEASQTEWLVNSTYATVTADNSQWTRSASGKTLDDAHATFVASEPGIYTVQADVNGNYTVPIVITVGYSSLTSVAHSSPETGIQNPQTADFSTAQTSDVVIANQYAVFAANPVNGLVPIVGWVPSGVQDVSIIFSSADGNTIYASYTVPVSTSSSGQQFIGEEFLSPIASGAMTIEIIPNLPATLTQWNNSQTPAYQPITLSYNMSGGTNLSQQQLDTMPNAKIDYNLSDTFQKIAETLMENSPTVDTGIEAINNYVSDFMTYDTSELNPGGYRYQDAVQTLQTGTGVCEDYAELTTALLRSIGVPTETIIGTAQDPTGELPRDPSAANDHEWLKAWDGSQWIVMDPTWSDGLYSNGGFVWNNFFTATNLFTAQHDATEVGSEEQ